MFSATAHMASAAQILVVSPDRALAQTVERSAVALGHVALVATSVDEARAVLVRVEVDVVCLDSLISDDADGLWRWAAEALDGGLPPAVLLASPVETNAPSTVPDFLRNDHGGTVAKPVRGSDLARELTRVLAAKPRIERESALLWAGRVTLDVGAHELLIEASGVVALTPTESRLLRCLMERAGVFVPADELLELVWGYPAGTGGREVVRAHVSNVRRKLRSIGEDPQLLRSIPYLGYGIVVGEATPATSSL